MFVNPKDPKEDQCYYNGWCVVLEVGVGVNSQNWTLASINDPYLTDLYVEESGYPIG